MLRDVVGTFLDSLAEREFDAPLLALLATRGFHDIHFIHGAFEFGKDVVAKGINPATGDLSQYAIQSKAGDIGQAAWREVRPQLEEAEYNTRAHPNFDEHLPRVAVLLTTGRLKGAAPVDAQEFKTAVESRGLAGFEVWDRSTLSDWLCLEPSIGLLGTQNEPALMSLVSAILEHRVNEPAIERYARAWLSVDDSSGFAVRSSIEGALIVSLLRRSGRLDLASFASLQILRAASVRVPPGLDARAVEMQRKCRDAARALFEECATGVLTEVEPILSDPKDLARATAGMVSLVTYPATTCRLAEIIALLAIATTDDGRREHAVAAVQRLAEHHPGTHRPPSDQFGASLVAVVAVLAREDRDAAIGYLRDVAQWLLDRHDEQPDGLGLGSLDESEEIVTERLVGGALEPTKLQVRRSSFVSTVVLDLCAVVGAAELYEALRQNLSALRVVPEMTAADESRAHWRRGGAAVHWQPRVEYGAWEAPRPAHHRWVAAAGPRDTLLLGAACRSRHYVTAISEWINEATPPS